MNTYHDLRRGIFHNPEEDYYRAAEAQWVPRLREAAGVWLTDAEIRKQARNMVAPYWHPNPTSKGSRHIRRP